MAQVLAHKTRQPLAHPERPMTHHGKLLLMLCGLVVAAFIFLAVAWTLYG